jgi:hypothetical protein
MSARLTSLRQRRWLASLLVLTFALRALIPAGFMPAGDGSLTLRICPEGFLAALLPGHGDGNSAAHAAVPLIDNGAGHHQHDAHALGHHQDHGPGSTGTPTHDHKSWMSTHCAFGALASAPPPTQSPVIAIVSEAVAPRAETASVAVSQDLRFRIAQPRAPPTRLI